LLPVESRLRAAADSARFLGRLGIVDPLELFAISIEALRRYPLRTALSVLGVVLGVAAVIAMMSVSEGAGREALRQMELLGLDNIVVRARPTSPDQPQGDGLSVRDAQRLPLLVPLVSTAAPLVERYVPVSGPRQAPMARVVGVTAEYADILHLEAREGRLLASLDVRSAAHRCVLGATIARSLFGSASPLGQVVRTNDTFFHVVGVLAERGTDAGAVTTIAARDLNTAVLVPLSALSGAALEWNPEQKVDEVWLHVADAARVTDLGRVTEQAMLKTHHGIRDFELVVPRELLNQRLRTQRTFAIVVGSVAALSLLVGGIGIMNIMLASVLERTREIGIRRTVGARRRDITLQFVTEALLMTLAGGAAGLVLGAAGAVVITAYAGWQTRVSPVAIGLALTVATAVGLGFGIYPATRAARLDPAEAMRYE
jgi:putative ABC transport system permease protein